MLSDLTTSLKASLYERAISPLFGAFALSWIVWNYRLVFLLGAELPIKEKFEYIDGTLYLTFWDYLFQGAVFPLSTAVLFIFAYPIPAKKIYEYWHGKQQEMLKLKMSIEEETPLSKKESILIKREMLRAETTFDEELSRRNVEIDRLKKLTAELESEIESLKGQKTRKLIPVKVPHPKEKWPPSLDEFEVKLMATLLNAGGRLSEREIANNFKVSKVKTRNHLEQLADSNLVKEANNIYSLTAEGRRYILDTGLA